MSRGAALCVIAIGFATALFLLSCSGGSRSMSSSLAAMVNVAVCDPTTCSGPQGPFSHIFLTITDVQINASAGAGENDPGWIDLTPSLQQNPQQVDMLGQANNQCFPGYAGLGDRTSTRQLSADSYHPGE